MMRIALFLLTNLAVIVVASITLSLLGVNSYLAQSGTGLDLGNLLIFSAVFGFAGSFISLLISKPMAKWSTRAQIIKQPSNSGEKWLLDTVRELSEKAGIGMPEVGVFPAQQSNAFATGWNKNAALVAVSQGMLQRFRPEEVRAVLAHEIGHVANGDMVTLSLIQGVVNTFVIFAARVVGSVVDSFLRRDGEGGLGFGYYIVVFIAEIIFGIAASTIVMWFSRKRSTRCPTRCRIRWSPAVSTAACATAWPPCSARTRRWTTASRRSPKSATGSKSGLVGAGHARERPAKPAGRIPETSLEA